MQPKVLVGCPTYSGMEYCLDKYAKAVKSLTHPNYDILLVDNSKDNSYKKKIEGYGIKVIKDEFKEKPIDRVVSSRNILREHALSNGYDCLLSLEQDVIPPRNVIELLLRHKKPAITGIYYKPFRLRIKFQNREVVRKSIRPLIYKFIPGIKDKFHFCTAKDVADPKLMRIAASGIGCMLIDKETLSKIPFRSDGTAFDDNFFCEDLRNSNIPLFADTTVKCMHLILKKPEQTKKE
ncbi:MAG: hypothetical protein AABW87_01520 [Nanoarchaeota archaeon]